MEKTLEREVKSFKEVHIELERESALLAQNHNIKDFKEKGDFLSGVGFSNSIATKLYTGIAENHQLFDEYNVKYKGQYKFILKPQLERICEKYNLYVRDTNVFLGDIPEPNIKEIMNFKIHLNDVPYSVAKILVEELKLSSATTVMEFQAVGAYSTQYPLNGYKIDLKDYNTVLLKIISDGQRSGRSERKYDWRAHHDAAVALLQIAAVRSLFHASAVMDGSPRILSSAELLAKAQVDLDPIVLIPVFKHERIEGGRAGMEYVSTHNGYLIVTAWGDEANDELVLNHTKN